MKTVYIKTSLKIFISILLLIFLARLPFQYYILLRFLIMAVALFLALYSYREKKLIQVVAYLLLALLFQPFQRIVFGRQLWQIVDSIVALLLIISIFLERKPLSIQQVNKPFLAKELLIFSVGAAFVFLTWGFLLLRNQYFRNKVVATQNRITQLTAVIDTLPSTTGLFQIYNLTPFYVVNDLKNKQIIVSKRDEEFFLQDNPGAQQITVSSAGVFEANHFLHYKYFGKEKYSGDIEVEGFLRVIGAKNLLHPEVVQLESPKTFLEFVKFDQFFRLCTQSEEYRSTLKSLVDVSKPLFDSILAISARYTEEVRLKRNGLIMAKKDSESQLPTLQVKVLDKENIKRRLVTVAIVLGIILYPLRISIKALVWSIRTLKSK